MQKPHPDRRGPSSVILPSVQWLRGIAAMMVVILHLNFHTEWLREKVGAASSWFAHVPWSFGIHIFFVISGFIMILTTRSFGEPGAWTSFLARRLVRIVPLYWLLTTVMVAGVLMSPHSLELPADKWRYIVSSYLFIPVLRTADDLRPILGQGWTLDYEMFFYAAFAFAILWPRRTGMAILTIGFLTLAILGRNLDISTPMLFTWTDGIILEFILGIQLGMIYQSGWRLSRPTAVVFVLAGVALGYPEFNWPAVFSAGLPAMLIVGGLVLCPRLEDSAATGWLTVLGNASYSIYLSHTLVLRPFRDVWARLIDGAWSPFMFFVAGVLVSVAVGCAIHYLVERPMLRYLSHRLRASPAPPALPVAAAVG
ncbi:acyltransferase [Bradyrhizobium lablabi]|uniref:acyltransferase family protein n=1 Tax=Bradyrhizobium lablabi TaxID=722472 RepID=UPI001BA624BE|nr:acyltransferase [Bradyrhizobium lablabi]MBR0692710.1 acyltransferase [Bradyrhizobium lablabi]